MRRFLNPAAACLAALALGACHGTPAEELKGQTARLDSNTVLSISMEGADSTWSPRAASPEGGSIARVLQNADGKILFAYGIDATRSPDGTYQLTLKPAKSGPTFRASRIVTVHPGQDSVRVELMAQPQTGQKIADVFELHNQTVATFHETFLSPLIRAHNAFFRFVHGD